MTQLEVEQIHAYLLKNKFVDVETRHALAMKREFSSDLGIEVHIRDYAGLVVHVHDSWDSVEIAELADLPKIEMVINALVWSLELAAEYTQQHAV